MAVRDDARDELNRHFEAGLNGVPIEEDVPQLMKLAFEMTLGPAIDLHGDGYWANAPKTFALGNAERMGKVAAILSDAAGRTTISRADYAVAVNAVVERAKVQCPGGAAGPQCRYWVPLVP